MWVRVAEDVANGLKIIMRRSVLRGSLAFHGVKQVRSHELTGPLFVMSARIK